MGSNRGRRAALGRGCRAPMMPLVPGAEHYKEIAGKLREVGLRKGRSDAFITEFARDSLLEGSGFELSVPREMGSAFRGFVRVGVDQSSARRIIRGVVGLGNPIELLRRLEKPPLTAE